VHEPIGNEESVKLVEISVVEYQQKAATVRTQPLDGVWYSGREKPQVSLADVAYKAFAVLVHGGDASVAI
jgi:hypothetical protein